MKYTLMCVFCFAALDVLAQVSPLYNQQQFKYTDPISLNIHNNFVIYSAKDIYGREPWVTDGTNNGTKTLGNLDGTNASSNPSHFTKLGNKTFFIAFTNSAYRLYETDGTITGTKFFMNLNDSGNSPMLTVSFEKRDSFFSFLANTDSFGIQLWVSDGTETGTKAITKINNAQSAYILGKIKDDYYFTYEDDVYGKEVFKTNGKYPYNIELVKDIMPSFNSSFPITIAQIDSKIIFLANDSAHGRELWMTDGTNLGTTLLKDLNPGYGNTTSITNFIYHDSKYLFLVNINSETNVWQTDGSSNGTRQFLKPIDCEFISQIYVFQNTIFAYAKSKTLGYELFINSNDSLIFYRDFNFGTNSSYIKNFTTVNDTLLFFTALSANNASDIWVVSKSNLSPRLFLRLPFLGDIKEIAYLNNSMILSVIDFSSGEFILYKLNDKVVGLEALSSIQSTIYPNPASKSINIKSTQTIKNISIYNHLGQLVLERPFEDSSSNELNIQHLNSGVYMLKIEDVNGGAVWEKLIKE